MNIALLMSFYLKFNRSLKIVDIIYFYFNKLLKNIFRDIILYYYFRQSSSPVKHLVGKVPCGQMSCGQGSLQAKVLITINASYIKNNYKYLWNSQCFEGRIL